jgi:hypothetical protein
MREIKPTGDGARGERQGRELDAEIARFLGWANVEPNCYTPIGKEWCGDDPEGAGGFYHTGRKIVPRFSESIEAAMEAVEKMRERGYGWTICTHRDGWFVRCFELPDEGLHWRHSSVVKTSLAEAVCLSALAALEESEIAKHKCAALSAVDSQTDQL